MRFIDCSTPLMMLEPPGWRAQSKSIAEGMGEGEGEGLWNCGRREWMRLLKAGRTAADAIRGTRGVSTTFQP